MPEVPSPSTSAAAGATPLCVCVLGLGGGGFHFEVQKIIQQVKRPLELVLVYAGPEGGLIYWNSKDVVRAKYIVRSPSLTGDGLFAKAIGSLRNVREAFRILRAEKPDVVLGAGTAQALPFAIAAKLLGTRLWFVESITRALHPCRTCAWMHRFGLGSRVYYYWRSLRPQLPRAVCMEEDAP
jgi:UDP-N-acetylglucosamine:LPS N-acetylglucosamine transferase